MNSSDVATRDVTIAGRHGSVAARLYRHGDESAEMAFVWVHGGGFVSGDLDMPEAHWVATEIAARGFSVLSVDYRKCERGLHYPIPSDDILDAWLWADGHAREFGVRRGRVHLGGASAGADLVAGVTKRLRDGAGPMPVSLVLAYPIVHKELPPASPELTAALIQGGPLLFTSDLVRGMNLNWVGSEALLDDPYAFAANGDVSRQPPTFILNSEIDSLRASGEAYAAQLDASGVRVRLLYEPGTAHGHLNNPSMPEATRSIERMTEWIATAGTLGAP
jgi:acetyl esterase